MFLEVLVAVVTFFVAAYALQEKRFRKGFPPGPWGVPILGHLPLLGNNPHLTLMKWKETYGPVMFLKFGQYPTLVLNDVKSVKEAFSHPAFIGRAQIVPFVIGTEQKGISWGDTPAHSEQRTFFKKNIKDFGNKSMESKIQDEIQEFAETLNNRIGQKIKVNHMFAASMVNAVWSIIIGERFSLNDPKIHEFSDMVTTRFCQHDTPISQLSMFVPWLAKYIGDLSGFNDKISVLREIREYVSDRIENRKKTWVRGQPRDLTDEYFDKIEETTDSTSSFHKSYNAQAISTVDVLMASVETTGTTLDWLLFFMAKDPECQTKLQAEIDEVIGTTRVPTLADRPNMPYVNAMIWEVIRVGSIIPLGVFHRTLEPANFRGYDIPKDTWVISNIYACQHDPKVWEDDMDFKPSRFLDENGKFKKNENMACAFGVGKRNCFGEAMAKDQLFLWITTLFQRFEVSFPPGPIPKMSPVFGLTLAPNKFEVIFIQRTFK